MNTIIKTFNCPECNTKTSADRDGGVVVCDGCGCRLTVWGRHVTVEYTVDVAKGELIGMSESALLATVAAVIQLRFAFVSDLDLKSLNELQLRAGLNDVYDNPNSDIDDIIACWYEEVTQEGWLEFWNDFQKLQKEMGE